MLVLLVKLLGNALELVAMAGKALILFRLMDADVEFSRKDFPESWLFDRIVVVL